MYITGKDRKNWTVGQLAVRSSQLNSWQWAVGGYYSWQLAVEYKSRQGRQRIAPDVSPGKKCKLLN